MVCVWSPSTGGSETGRTLKLTGQTAQPKRQAPGLSGRPHLKSQGGQLLRNETQGLLWPLHERIYTQQEIQKKNNKIIILFIFTRKNGTNIKRKANIQKWLDL